MNVFNISTLHGLNKTIKVYESKMERELKHFKELNNIVEISPTI